MTERMHNYRFKKEAEGMVHLRIWIPKEYERFFKEMAKECRPNKPLKVPPRYGRRATDRQIQLAETLQKAKIKMLQLTCTIIISASQHGYALMGVNQWGNT